MQLYYLFINPLGSEMSENSSLIWPIVSAIFMYNYKQKHLNILSNVLDCGMLDSVIVPFLYVFLVLLICCNELQLSICFITFLQLGSLCIKQDV